MPEPRRFQVPEQLASTAPVTCRVLLVQLLPPIVHALCPAGSAADGKKHGAYHDGS